MKNIILIIQIVLGVLLILIILLQSKGSGIGGAFGSDSAVYRSKRGVEKIIFRLTIALSILFVLTSLLAVLSK